MPAFSIITITKANPVGLARTKASVEAQTFTDYEWVVVDGDAEPDAGIYDAMNKGIARARGDYLIFMNAGDCLAAPDTLSRVFPLLEGCDFAYGDALEDGKSKPARHDIARGMVTHHQAMFYKNGPRRYDLGYRIAADYKFTVQAWGQARKTVYLPFPVCVFEQGGISQRRTAQGRREQAAIRRETGIQAPFWLEAAQAAAVAIKRAWPALYWAMRRAV